MKILVVSDHYPSERSPTFGIFVYNLIQELGKLDNEVTVVNLVSFKRRLKSKKHSYGEELNTVHRPVFLNTSAKFIFKFNTYRISEKFRIDALKKVVKNKAIEFDVVYTHFLSNAFIAVGALYSYNKPIFAAVGEYHDIDVRKSFYNEFFYKSTLAKITGFVAVSQQIKTKLISYGVAEDQIIVRPNAVNFTRFFKRDKKKMREKHGLPLDKKLLVFVGRFIESKGPLRLLEAVKDRNDIGLVFVGSGNQELKSDQIVFQKKVLYDEVPELLSAGDVFVLPTLHEGSCNAIVEAMACGLPIVSSDIPEIRVQCDPSFSILVDPNDVNDLRLAIDEILNDEEKLFEMSNNALKSSKRFDIRERAKNILQFLQQ